MIRELSAVEGGWSSTKTSNRFDDSGHHVLMRGVAQYTYITLQQHTNGIEMPSQATNCLKCSKIESHPSGIFGFCMFAGACHPKAPRHVLRFVLPNNNDIQYRTSPLSAEQWLHTLLPLTRRGRFNGRPSVLCFQLIL
jgi:hypothetical protein